MPLLKFVLALAAVYAVLALFLGPRRAWALWQRFGHAMGDFLARVVLTAFYFTILVPFAFIAKAVRDPLGQKLQPGAFWTTHADYATDLDIARRQS